MSKPRIIIRSKRDLPVLRKTLRHVTYNTYAGMTDPDQFVWVLAQEESHRARETRARVVMKTDDTALWGEVEEILRVSAEPNPWA